MIAKLSGLLDSVYEGSLIIDVNGVGYQVFASRRTLTQAGEKGAPISLLIDTHVREDHIHLFGFIDAGEQQWFRLLTSVQGVGAKVGLSILSASAPDQLMLAIASGDQTALTRADGVGPKLATRILTELKDKAGKMDLSAAAANAKGKTKAAAASAAQPAADVGGDVISALVNLGYARADAYAALMQARGKANDNERDNLQALIRLALKELSA